MRDHPCGEFVASPLSGSRALRTIAVVPGSQSSACPIFFRSSRTKSGVVMPSAYAHSSPATEPDTLVYKGVTRDRRHHRTPVEENPRLHGGNTLSKHITVSHQRRTRAYMGAGSSQEVGRVHKGKHLFTRGHVHLGNSVEHTEERPSSAPRTVAVFTCPRSAEQPSHAPDQRENYQMLQISGTRRIFTMIVKAKRVAYAASIRSSATRASAA